MFDGANRHQAAVELRRRQWTVARGRAVASCGLGAVGSDQGEGSVGGIEPECPAAFVDLVVVVVTVAQRRQVVTWKVVVGDERDAAVILPLDARR